jgi:hypothetical protein
VIPDTTREALLQSMERFDRELRQQPDWSSKLRVCRVNDRNLRLARCARRRKSALPD